MSWVYGPGEFKNSQTQRNMVKEAGRYIYSLHEEDIPVLFFETHFPRSHSAWPPAGLDWSMSVLPFAQKFPRCGLVFSFLLSAVTSISVTNR